MNKQEYLNKTGAEYETKLSGMGIPIGNVLRYMQHSINKMEWGLCYQVGEGLFIVSINELLLDSKYKDGLINTICHELIHTCPDCYNHGIKWKEYALIINQTLDIPINEHDNYKEKGVDLFDYMKIHQYKYAIQCDKCGLTYFRKRKDNFTTNYRYYKCGACGGSLYDCCT